MRAIQVLMFAGVFSLYIGFSAVQGYLLRSTLGPRYRSAGWHIVLAYVLLIWVPTSAFILTLSWLPASLRVLAIISGMIAMGLVTFRPAWIPNTFWSRAFSRRYLGITMVLVALGSLVPWLPDPNAASLTLGLSACMAGLSALRGITIRV